VVGAAARVSKCDKQSCDLPSPTNAETMQNGPARPCEMRGGRASGTGVGRRRGPAPSWGGPRWGGGSPPRPVCMVTGANRASSPPSGHSATSDGEMLACGGVWHLPVDFPATGPLCHPASAKLPPGVRFVARGPFDVGSGCAMQILRTTKLRLPTTHRSRLQARRWGCPRRPDETCPGGAG
jgi:hypothetical protein